MIFCNGQFFLEHEPVIEVFDRGFLVGDAVFTTVKVVDGKAEFLQEHIERLKKQCASLQIIPPEIKISDVDELIKKNQATTGIFKLKIIITGGSSPSLNLSKRLFGKHIMMLTPVLEVIPKEYRLTLFPIPLVSATSQLKTLSYLDRLFVQDYALKQGFDDALVLSMEGFVKETSFSNIFWCVGDNVFVPDFTLDFLVGVTLSQQIKQFEAYGKKIHFVREKPENIPKNAHVFICNSMKGIVPVISIDNTQFYQD